MIEDLVLDLDLDVDGLEDVEGLLTFFFLGVESDDVDWQIEFVNLAGATDDSTLVDGGSTVVLVIDLTRAGGIVTFDWVTLDVDAIVLQLALAALDFAKCGLDLESAGEVIGVKILMENLLARGLDLGGLITGFTNDSTDVEGNSTVHVEMTVVGDLATGVLQGVATVDWVAGWVLIRGLSGANVALKMGCMGLSWISFTWEVSCDWLGVVAADLATVDCT
jgi:hypothetical protein